MICFKLFGPLEARLENGAQLKFATRKVALVAAWLSTTPDKPWSRNLLAERVWPESYREIALASLRQALSSLRKGIADAGVDPETIISGDRIVVGYRPDVVTSDYSEFQQKVKRALLVPDPEEVCQMLSEALAECKGPFLEEFDGNEVSVLRDQVRMQVGQARRRLVEALIGIGRPGEALDRGIELFYQDPSDEGLATELIRVAKELGRTNEAVRIFDSLNEALDSHLGLRPPAALQDSIREVRESAFSVPLWPSNIKKSLRKTIGRDEEIRQLNGLLGPQAPLRALTLLGPGGVGKTTLARETAYALLESYDQAVWFVNLASTFDQSEVLRVTQEALGTQASDTTIWLKDFGRQLGRKPALLVMDNLEQISPEVRLPLTELVEELPSVKILCTSRRTVGVPGETVFRVSPLAAPRRGSSSEEIVKSPSVDLYVDRARSIVPGYEPEEPEALGELCRRLDGLPLALCLAATKADVLTVNETIDQLEARFELLRADDDETEDRHRRLWACIDWSYSIIPETNLLMSQLSVFRGGWTLESAKFIADEDDVLAKLQTLRRHCLVEEVSRGRTVRFGMLESIHDFAQSKLVDREGTESRHADWFLSLAESAAKASSWPERQVAYTQLDDDIENFRKAVATALMVEPKRVLTVAVQLSGYFIGRGRQNLGLGIIDSAMRKVDAELDAATRVRVYLACAQLFRSLRRDEEGRAAIDKCLEAAMGCDVATRIQVMSSLAGQYLNEGRLEDSAKVYSDALDLCLSANLYSEHNALLGALAVTLLMLGRLEECRDCSERALSTARTNGDPAAVSGILYTLAHISLMERRLDAALELVQESISVLEEAEMHAAGFGRLTLLAELHMRRGDWSEGLRTLQHSVEQLSATGMSRDLADCASRAALWCEHEGELDLAASFLSFYEPYTRGFVGRSQADWRPSWQDTAERIQASIGKARWMQAAQVFGGDVSAMGRRILMLK